MSENFDMPFCYAFLCEIRRKSDHVLRAEPVGIEIGKTERFIQCDRRRVSLDNLKIRFRWNAPIRSYHSDMYIAVLPDMMLY